MNQTKAAVAAPELTVRSIIVGLIVAVVIGSAYPYCVLKLGFGPNLSVVSAFFGFIVLGKTAQQSPSPITPPVMTSPPGAAKVEQTSQGTRPGATLVASFDGLGIGFAGPHGTATLRNPSDNSLAVGPSHIFQIVNTRMAIFAKKGKQFDATGKVLYGPVPTQHDLQRFRRRVRSHQQR